MKVNKSSWHYKLMDYFNFKIIRDLSYGENVTLCRYFWNVVGSLLLLLVATAAVIGGTGFLLCVAFILLSPLSYLTQAYFGFGWDAMSKMGVAGIWFMWVLLPLLIGLVEAFKGNMKVFPSWMKIKLTPPAASSKPNILVEYVKAKKNKFCPLIELDKE